MSIAKMQAICDVLASPAINVGYDQWQRWSFYNQTKKGFIPNMETDCSASCGAIAHAAGYPIDLSDPFSTETTCAARFKAAGFTLIPVSGWSKDRLFGEVRAGDFLLGPGHIVFCRKADLWWSAEQDENGKPYGGQGGDQTGREALFRAPYMRSRTWTYIFRPPAEEVVEAAPLDAKLPLLRKDSAGGPAGKQLKVWLKSMFSYASKVGTSDDWIGGDTWLAMQEFARRVGLLGERESLDAWGPRCWAAAIKLNFKL